MSVVGGGELKGGTKKDKKPCPRVCVCAGCRLLPPQVVAQLSFRAVHSPRNPHSTSGGAQKNASPRAALALSATRP